MRERCRFLAPRVLSADAVWQAKRASTVWRPEGRKGGCESALGPQPLNMDRPANCINKCHNAGPVGGRRPRAESSPNSHQLWQAWAGWGRPLGRAPGPELRPRFVSSSCLKAEELPGYPHSPKGGGWGNACLGRGRALEVSVAERPPSGDWRKMGWGPRAASIREEPRNQPFLGRQF